MAIDWTPPKEPVRPTWVDRLFNEALRTGFISKHWKVAEGVKMDRVVTGRMTTFKPEFIPWPKAPPNIKVNL